MNWTAKTHPLERLAEWGAPLVLAGASAWAASMAGKPPMVSGLAAVIAFAIGMVTMRMAGTPPVMAKPGFQPASFEGGSAELLLDSPLIEAACNEDELLLDDPLKEIAADSRVVQLFAHPEPTPGELVLRISDYLKDGSRPAPDRPTP